MSIDSFDRKLINLLARDASRSNEQLARELSVSSSTISRRLKHLIKKEVIRIVALPKPAEVGLPLVAIIAFDVAHDKLSNFTRTLAAYQEIISLYSTTGRYDVIAISWFSSTEELYHFLETKVSKLEGFRDTETFICLHVEKAMVPTEGGDLIPDIESSL